jgi:lipid-binding SYLF domain-containing protein
MKRTLAVLCGLLLTVGAGAVRADEYSDTTELFRKAGESAEFFKHCYGYAVFPTVGKGGLGVGGAYGTGRVFAKGAYIGDSSMTQLSIGFQAGGEAYSQIIFFDDKRALDEFTSGDFELGADASAVAITAAAGASAGTAGASASASSTEKDAKTSGRYYKGMAVFIIVKGGAMAQAAVGGQKFKFKPKK